MTIIERSRGSSRSAGCCQSPRRRTTHWPLGGGRTTKIHTLSDRACCPPAVLRAGGRIAAGKAGAPLLQRLPACRVVIADEGYDSDAIRRQIEAARAAPIIQPKVYRRWKPCFSPVLDWGCYAIERMFGRLKDLRRIATRYDRSATNYLAAVCLVATVSY